MTSPAPAQLFAGRTRILAIDPGYQQSAWLRYDCAENRPVEFGIDPNADVLRMLMDGPDGPEAESLAIEMVESFGMAVGKEVFETVWWIGRFCQAHVGPHTRLYRREVKMHLCGNNRASDSNIRQAIIDRFGPTKELAIGLKKSPGPLFGISKDLWSALAIAVTWTDRHAVKSRPVPSPLFAGEVRP